MKGRRDEETRLSKLCRNRMLREASKELHSVVQVGYLFMDAKLPRHILPPALGVREDHVKLGDTYKYAEIPFQYFIFYMMQILIHPSNVQIYLSMVMIKTRYKCDSCSTVWLSVWPRKSKKLAMISCVYDIHKCTTRSAAMQLIPRNATTH
jgi:hypothetical protein